MNTTPFVSIIIPAYNEQLYIENCIEHLQNQTYKNKEIIVVDNNSTDNTVALAKKKKVRVVTETMQGITPARQKGFHEARGEIILRTDADAKPPKDWVERIVVYFNNHPDEIALTGLVNHYDVSWGDIPRVVLDIWWKTARLYMGHYPLTGPNCAIRSAIAKKAEPHYDDALVHEDMDLSCHIADYGKIGYDSSLIVPTSARRWKRNFLPECSEYILRGIRTIWIHHPWFRKQHISTL